jgi:hypothetical protein
VTVHSAASDSSTLLRARRSPTFDRRRWPRARPPFTRAATLFGALRASVFEARRRLPTSATATTCGHFDQDSRVLAGTVAATTFLFFDAPRGPSCDGGGARRAARRSALRSPGAGSSRLRGLARPRWIDERVDFTTIDVHGPPDRAKDASASLRRFLIESGRGGAHAWFRVGRRRSPPRRPKSTLRRRCARTPGKRPERTRQTGLDPAFSAAPRRATASDGPGAFHRRDGRGSRGLLLVPDCVGLSLTPPTRFPISGEKCWMGLASTRFAV